jgi:type I restriction enzyme R subunit
MDRKLTVAQRETVEDASGGISLRTIIADMIDRLDPDREDERARATFNLPADTRPTEAQTRAVQAAMREEAAAPIAHNPKLRDALLEVRKAQEVTIDVATADALKRAGFRPDLAIDHEADRALVGAFEAFCKEHQHELDALTVLYSRPYAQRLTRGQLMELVAAIQRPPRQWTSEALWAAYERVEQGRVRGASRGKLLTDVISLARHALGVDDELVSYADQAHARFENWLAQQANGGRVFTDEQRVWLGLIRDRIVVDLEVRQDDFDETPFAEKGGLGKAWGLFGEELEEIVDALNRELVA